MKREEGRGKREEGRDKREEGRDKRQGRLSACRFSGRSETVGPCNALITEKDPPISREDLFCLYFMVFYFALAALTPSSSRAISRSLNFWILPEAVMGKAGRKRTKEGILNFAILAPT